jgi:hypothetical protein
MSPEDDKLVNFLRYHRPSPPSPRTGEEEEILRRIDSEEKVPPRSRIASVTTLAAFLTALVLIPLGYSRWFNASPALSSVSDQELETFLLENWRETLDEPSNRLVVPPSEIAGRVTPEPHLTYSIYYP